MSSQQKKIDRMMNKTSYAKPFNPQNKLKEIQNKLKGRWYLDTFVEKVIFLTGGLSILFMFFRIFVWIVEK